jgi:hypothetical protein
MSRRSIALIANPGSRVADPDAVAERLGAAGADVRLFDVGEAERAAGSGAERLAVAGGAAVSVSATA